MANLIISQVCNLKCPYCFAGQFLEDASQQHAEMFITPEAFEERLDFLDHSGIDEIRLIGGEPTLHPAFPDLIRHAHQRHKRLVVFSHGLMPERAIACLEVLPPEKCLVLINMSATRQTQLPSPAEKTRRNTIIQRLGARALLGFNIYTPNFNLEEALPLIEAAGCQKSIRVGLAQPIWNGDNIYLHPKQYRAVGMRLVSFAQQAAQQHVKLEFDCGFVRCMFSDEELAILKRAGTTFEARCNPILDIDLGGQAIHCFPLTGCVQATLGSQDAKALRTELEAQTHLFRQVGIYKECSKCPFKQQGECSGGCLANTLRRFQHPPIRLVLPEASPLES